jgi:hypothetical protein
VGATCLLSFIAAGVIYCCREEPYAESFKKGELHCILISISIIAFVYDIASDVFLSLQYYLEGNYTYFALTSIFIIAPVFFSYIALVALVANKAIHMSKVKWCGSMISVVALGPLAAVLGHLLV